MSLVTTTNTNDNNFVEKECEKINEYDSRSWENKVVAVVIGAMGLIKRDSTAPDPREA